MSTVPEDEILRCGIEIEYWNIEKLVDKLYKLICTPNFFECPEKPSLLMKHTNILAALAAMLLAATAAAQSPQANDRIITLRAGHVLHSGDPTGGMPYSSFCISTDFTLGKGFLGVTADFPGGPRKTTAVEGRFGYRYGGRLQLAGYLSGRYLWEEDFSQMLFGAGTAVAYKLTGPLGLFADVQLAHPLVNGYDGPRTTRAGQLIFSCGITLSF